MEVYSDVIADCKAGKRAIRWVPAAGSYLSDGLLEIHDKKAVRAYSVTEFLPEAGWDGRAFQVAKADGSDGYTVFICRDARGHTCDCAAGTYRKVNQCCHVAALAAVVANGWLPDPKCDPREAGSE